MERPTLYLSGVPSEFGSFRSAIKAILAPKDIAAEEQLELPPDFDSVAAALSDKIRRAAAVICLIGESYGAEPIAGREGQPRRSYAQIEYDLARQHGKPTYLFFAEGPDSFDQRANEGDDKRKRQANFVNDLQRLTFDWRSFTSRADLEGKIGALPLVLSSQRAIGPIVLRSRHPALVGREAATERLDGAWNDAAAGVLVLRAPAGAGKTALVTDWIAALRGRDWPGVRHKFEWSFDPAGTRGQAQSSDGTAAADLFVAAALSFYGDREPQQGSPFERGGRLASLVAKNRGLLILDGLEPLQQPPGRLNGQLTDPAMRALLRGLARHNPGLCIVTTRERIADLDDLYESGAIDWELPPLTEPGGAALLRGLGVDAWPATLQRLSREVGGHALTLELIARYVALAHGGDLGRCEPFGFVGADAEVQGGHTVRALATVEAWLAGGDACNRRAAAILRLLGLFDRPAEPAALTMLRSTKAIPGLTETIAGAGDDEWREAVERLEQLGLTIRLPYVAPVIAGYSEAQAQAALRDGELSDPPAPLPSTAESEPLELLDTHAVIRERSARRLRQESVQAWREAHRRLFEHLRASVPYWPEGLVGLQPLYRAIGHACKAGLHEEARTQVYRDRILRGTGVSGFYSTTKLAAIGADLSGLGSFFDAPWRRPSPKLMPVAQSWLIGLAANGLRAIGRIGDAIEPARVAFEMAAEKRDWRNGAIAASCASEVELLGGEVASALATAERAVSFADRSDDDHACIRSRTIIADALHQSGRAEDCLRLFAEAERLQAKADPSCPRLHGLQGFDYCDALLAGSEQAAWRVMMEIDGGGTFTEVIQACAAVTERAEQTLAAATRQQLSLDIGLDHLTLARAALYEEVLRSATGVRPGARRMPALTRASDHLAAAVNGLRRAAAVADLPRGLLTRAWLRFVRGDQRSCRVDLDEAWEMSVRAPMPLYVIDVHLTRARLFRDRDELEQARRLIDSCGYGHRRPQLADTDEAARGWT
ncbi:MAG TPA: ATP-binding protein [Terriglobales bacterium]|nr:ATP-binding protein [Terriglobales bacterium]